MVASLEWSVPHLPVVMEDNFPILVNEDLIAFVDTFATSTQFHFMCLDNVSTSSVCRPTYLLYYRLASMCDDGSPNQ